MLYPIFLLLNSPCVFFPSITMADLAESKSKRFRFNSESDKLLVTIVVQLGAHTPDHGTTEQKFDEVSKAFCDSNLFETMKKTYGTPEPKVNTLRKRFNSLIEKRRKENKVDIATSGQERDYSEYDLLLDNAIEDIDQKKQVEENDKLAKVKLNKELEVGGQSIRDAAMYNFLKSSESPAASPSKPIKNKRTYDHAFGNELSLVEEDNKNRHEREMKNLEINERRLVLEEKKFEVEREERRLANETQKMTIELMKSLVSKLGKSD